MITIIAAITHLKLLHNVYKPGVTTEGTQRQPAFYIYKYGVTTGANLPSMSICPMLAQKVLGTICLVQDTISRIADQPTSQIIVQSIRLLLV